MSSSKNTTPSIFESLIPIICLIIMLSASVYIYGDNSSYGGNQIALILCAGIASIIGIKNGFSWKEIETGIVKGISAAMGAILILLAVGAMIGTWIMSGLVPAMIYYGLNILSPSIFYFAACIICALSALSIGSSWTVAGTLGAALMGIAVGLGLSPEVTAGAVISGAYFGDKMSPLSDTTNLAPAVTETDLFTHIRHMIWTTGPSLLIALVIFLIMGINSGKSSNVEGLALIQNTISDNFNISLTLFIPLVVVFVMAFNKVPAFPTVLIGALIGGIFAVIFQPEVIQIFVGETPLSGALISIAGVWSALHSGFSIETGVEVVDSLLTRGGRSSMLNTVWLVITALTFGAVLETTKLLHVLVQALLSFVKSTGSLIITTIGTCIGINIVTADQYIAIVLPGRMFKSEFQKRNLHPKNLSRTLEDSATMTSPLVPWNTCGAFMSASLGIATLSYLPFCFFNLVNPIIAIVYAIMNFKIEKI